jgi:hypothetical protein
VLLRAHSCKLVLDEAWARLNLRPWLAMSRNSQ